MRVSILLGLLCSTLVSVVGGVEFNRDIRPILSENCFYCHGQDGNKRKADLRLDVRQIAVDSGAIVPGNPAKSSLIHRIHSTDTDEVMPPMDANRRLNQAQKELLETWIESGAAYEKHWAFVTPQRPVEPQVKNGTWVRNAIDRFVLEKLETVGVLPSPEADPATLIKRLSIDLTGLPPSPSEVDAFVATPDPLAYEQLVERLLNSRHYGERMALPWLDAARYADSNGFQQDGDTWQWIWRDWVVRALNADMPFDQFTIWQLAGDLLPDASVDQKIASGFNRNHLLNGEGGAIPEEQRFVNLFDRVDTTATTWLGLTMACAQCHDHKYDPITQRDYYSLMDAFNRVPETGTPQRQSSRIRVAAPFIELPTIENRNRIAKYETAIASLENNVRSTLDLAFADWMKSIDLVGDETLRKRLPRAVLTLVDRPKDRPTDAGNKTLDRELKRYFEQKEVQNLDPKIPQWDKLKKDLAAYKGDQIPRAMVMSDSKPRQTHILNRGGYLSPGEKVSFATPSFLPSLKHLPGNRLGLAQWLVSADQPLTARVQVNRIWQHFFGEGIVKTAEDFGVQSDYPIHMNLLDWLAVEFRERGWSLKQMQRLIVTSATYRQSSRMDPWHREEDIDNRLYARASRFRMPSMLLRDWSLESSGLLVKSIGGAPVYPYQPDNVWEALAITKERDFTYPASKGGDLYRRSLYTFWRRTVNPVNMFDASNRQTCQVRQSSTSTPLHALTTLNDPTWVEASTALALRCSKNRDTIRQQVAEAFHYVLCRQPSANEIEQLERTYERQLSIFRHEASVIEASLLKGARTAEIGERDPEMAALASVCLAILNFDEALTRE
jgi:hypothetical protein